MQVKAMHARIFTLMVKFDTFQTCRTKKGMPTMTAPLLPYALPQTLAADLVRVKDYWSGLLRGSARMPFADDLSLEALPDLAPRLALIEVFTLPERFRFSYIGEDIAASQSKPLADKFLDEIDLPFPFEFLRSQASAAVESGTPTCHSQPANAVGTQPAYNRLVLPLWGDGHTSLLLVAVDQD